LGDTPKLLAPISGRPYLAYLLDWLRRFGAKRIVLGLGHRAQAVVDFLGRNEAAYADLEIATVIEPQPLGTAGAVRFGRSRLHGDPVLIMNGDSFADADLCALVAHHRRAKAKATLLCVEVDDAGRYGRVDIDREGRVRGFIEKDPDFHGASAASAGVYLFSAALLDEIAAGNAASLERDVFGRAPAGSLAAFAGRFAFIDIGTPESLKLAERVVGNEAGGRPS
jgi:mannose-1-phosphate guanylyltransferase